MPFPFSIRGSVPIPNGPTDVPDDGVVIACLDQVEHEGGHVVARTERSIAFTTPLFRAWGSNWRFTVPLSAGSFEITRDPTGQRHLNYDLSTRRTAVLGTLMASGFFAFVAFASPQRLPWWVPLSLMTGGEYVRALLGA